VAALVVGWSVRSVNLVQNGNPHVQLGQRAVIERCSEDRYKHRVVHVRLAVPVEARLPQDCRWRIVLRVVGGEDRRHCSDGSRLDHLLLRRSTTLPGDQLAEDFPASSHSH
jgi:hypothetical protein